MTTKIELNQAQRAYLAHVFVDELSNHKCYAMMGSTYKSIFGDLIRFYFMPFKSMVLPPIDVEQTEEKDDKDNILNIFLKFTLELDLLPFITNSDMKLVITKTINKAQLDGVV